jgi:hypothetical protein
MFFETFFETCAGFLLGLFSSLNRDRPCNVGVEIRRARLAQGRTEP